MKIDKHNFIFNALHSVGSTITDKMINLIERITGIAKKKETIFSTIQLLMEDSTRIFVRLQPINQSHCRIKEHSIEFMKLSKYPLLTPEKLRELLIFDYKDLGISLSEISPTEKISNRDRLEVIQNLMQRSGLYAPKMWLEINGCSLPTGLSSKIIIESMPNVVHILAGPKVIVKKPN